MNVLNLVKPNTAVKKHPRPRFCARKCTQCWACVQACPHKAIRPMTFLFHSHPLISRGKCRGCGRCVEICPQGCYSFRTRQGK